ncbi:hypothetical protein SZN_13240 [Streptomyces zinciresistens K42]|uniref:Secreted protein n=1 Tax=Streptomyces zinciresistens K42 TaxID=700597 RepID=G2GAX5_9ACTN|nr:hypothetical protein [Streptomyces zinciresistens]EGX59366.1 hypothetical protein SZN_13240 [Streptomyces zinciresistens K42]
MITSQKALLKATSRIVTVGAALGIALAAGAATASAATAAPAQPAAVQAHGGGDDGDCSGVIVLLCN